MAYIGQLLLVMLGFGVVGRPARLVLALAGSQGHNATFLDQMSEHRLTLGLALEGIKTKYLLPGLIRGA